MSTFFPRRIENGIPTRNRNDEISLRGRRPREYSRRFFIEASDKGKNRRSVRAKENALIFEKQSEYEFRATSPNLFVLFLR